MAKRVVKDSEVLDYDLHTVEKHFRTLAGQRLATLGTPTNDIRDLATVLEIQLISIDGAHAKMRVIKSSEEIEALRKGARATDLGAQGLIGSCVPMTSDWQLLAAARSAYTVVGARDHICYICVSDMFVPDRDVPSQLPEGRILGQGSAVTFEISASVSAEYPGQVLRTVVIGKPSPLYQDLHAVAEEALARMRKILRPGTNALELIQASSIIEEAGYTTTDDLFHGLGAGYLQPIGTSISRIPQHLPDMEIQAGMAIVLQPNVTTLDHRAGVQTGEMVIITEDGFEDIHNLPRGIVQR